MREATLGSALLGQAPGKHKLAGCMLQIARISCNTKKSLLGVDLVSSGIIQHIASCETAIKGTHADVCIHEHVLSQNTREGKATKEFFFENCGVL